MMRRGFTIVELMVCIVLVVIFVTAVGPSMVKLLRVHESFREEGFVREKLLTLSAAYAAWLSLARSVVMTNANPRVRIISAEYPEETAGISFETNSIRNVLACHSMVSNEVWNVWFETKDGERKVVFDAYASLEPVKAGILDVHVTPANALITDFCRLAILATNQFWDVKKDAYSIRTVSTERIVRLWNASR